MPAAGPGGHEAGLSAIGAGRRRRRGRNETEVHAEGNAEIAKRFLDRAGLPLFAEPLPGDDPEWHEYTGLSTERTISIALGIHETVLRRRAVRRVRARRRFGQTVLGAALLLALLLGFLFAL